MKEKIQIPKVFKDIFEPKRYKILSGGRGSAKSESVARYLLICAMQRKERILCTREYQVSISDSVHRVLKDIIEQYELPYFEITNNSIRNKSTGSEFIFKGLKHNINEIKSMQGITKVWIEEAQSISKQSLDVLIPTIREENSELIFTFNRLFELDPVYQRFCMVNNKNVWYLHTTYKDNPFFPKVLELERLDCYENRNIDYGHIWLGQPIAQSNDAIIGRKLVLEAFKRDVDKDGLFQMGVDVARKGKDKTVISYKRGLNHLGFKSYSKDDYSDKFYTMKIVEEVIKTIKENKENKLVPIMVDDTGVGGGVVDRLQELGYKAIPINFGETANNKNKYNNVISEMWFEFLNKLTEIHLFDDARILNELTTREWKLDNKGRRCIESKDVYKTRGYPSPDFADAVLLSFYQNRQLKANTFSLTDGLSKNMLY